MGGEHAARACVWARCAGGHGGGSGILPDDVPWRDGGDDSWGIRDGVVWEVVGSVVGSRFGDGDGDGDGVLFGRGGVDDLVR